MSFRDIGQILKNTGKYKEVRQIQAQQEHLSSNAYKPFSDGKSLVQIAIELKTRASQAIILQGEYWDLKALPELDRIYTEVRCDPWAFINMYRLIKTTGMGTDQINRLLVFANELPALEVRKSGMIGYYSR